MPHWRIWRICPTVGVLGGKCGIEVTGVLRTGPGGVAAWLAGANPAKASAEAAATVVAAASFMRMRCNGPPRREMVLSPADDGLRHASTGSSVRPVMRVYAESCQC